MARSVQISRRGKVGLQKQAIFTCLQCGADTGCANRLVCDKCLAKHRRTQGDRPRRDRAKRSL